MSKNVLIINAYSYKNRGDSGIIVAMIQLIRATFGEHTDIALMSQYYIENDAFYKAYNVNSLKPIWNINNTSKNFIQKYFEGLLKTVFHKTLDINHLKGFDLVLSAGGGYLYSSRKGPLGVGFLNALYHIWLFKKLNIKVVLFPQSVGPIRYKIDKYFISKVLNKVDYFYSRESFTTKFLSSIKNLATPIGEIPDIAFLLNPKSNSDLDNLIDKTKSYNIGLTVLDWRFAVKGSKSSDIEKYLSKIANVINDIKKDHEVNVYIFPQVTVSETDGDKKVSYDLFNKIKKDVKVINLGHINNPEELVYLYSKMNVFIGSRMHSAIFAIAGGVPTIGLAYQPKTKGTFELINMGNQALSITDFTKNELHELTQKLLNSTEGDKIKAANEISILKIKINNAIASNLRKLS